MSTYTVSKVKTFKGREGEGFNADLLCDGKKVGEVINDASGGCIDFHWLDFASTRVDVNWIGYNATPVVLRCTPQEAAFYEFLRGKTWTLDLAGHDADNSPVQHDPDSYAGFLVDEFLDDRRFRRICKTKTMFRLSTDENGVLRTLSVAFSPNVKAKVVEKYGDKIEYFLNERLA